MDEFGSRKVKRSFSVVNWKPLDTQGHGGSSWKFWRRLSIRSRGHETGRSKGNKHQPETARSITKADITEPTLDLGHRPQRLPDVVVEGVHNLPVFNTNAIPPPKPPRLFLSKRPSNNSSRSSSIESVSGDETQLQHSNNNNSSPSQWHLLDSDDFTLETRQALGHITSSIDVAHISNYNPKSVTGKSSPTLFHALEEEEGGKRATGSGNGGGETDTLVAATIHDSILDSQSVLTSSSRNSGSAMGNSVVPVCIINDDATTPAQDANINLLNEIDPEADNNNTLTSAPSPPASHPPPLPSSPKSSPHRSRHYTQYHQNGFGTVPRKPKIVTPELNQKRYRRPRSRKLSSCDDQVSRQWRIMTSLLDLMCQRLDPYPLLDPLKRAGVLSNIQLQSFLGHCDRRSICEGIVDIIGKGTPKCLSVFSAAIASCPGNCTEILEILQAMREIDRLVYDIPEQKTRVNEDNDSGGDTYAEVNPASTVSKTSTTKATDSDTTTTTTTTMTTTTPSVTDDKILSFEIGYMSTDYSLKPLVELDRVRSSSGGGSTSSNGSANGGVGGGVGGSGVGGGGCGFQTRTYSRTSSYSLLDTSMGSTTTLDKACYNGNTGDPLVYSGLVMMSVNINGHNLAGQRCQALVDVIRTHNCISELHLGKTNLSGVEVTSLTDALSAENSSTTCHTLDLRLNAIDRTGANGICQLLRQTRFLRVLNLSSTELDSSSFQDIVSAISGNKSLVEFDGSFLDISDECCVQLRDMLRSNTNLQKLRLRGNNLSPVGCQTLCKGLAKNISLSVLDLSKNLIGDIGAEALALYLPDSHVTDVYIDGCGITLKGGKALAEMVSDSKRLRHLDISTNDLGDAGVSKMAAALERTSSLVNVSMNMCSITNVGFSKILDAMERNTSIHRLKLCYNKIGGDLHTNPAATSDNLRYRLRIVLSSKPKLKIILWGNSFEDTK